VPLDLSLVSPRPTGPTAAYPHPDHDPKPATPSDQIGMLPWRPRSGRSRSQQPTAEDAEMEDAGPPAATLPTGNRKRKRTGPPPPPSGAPDLAITLAPAALPGGATQLIPPLATTEVTAAPGTATLTLIRHPGGHLLPTHHAPLPPTAQAIITLLDTQIPARPAGATGPTGPAGPASTPSPAVIRAIHAAHTAGDITKDDAKFLESTYRWWADPANRP
jgi:hypothetical protein